MLIRSHPKLGAMLSFDIILSHAVPTCPNIPIREYRSTIFKKSEFSWVFIFCVIVFRITETLSSGENQASLHSLSLSAVYLRAILMILEYGRTLRMDSQLESSGSNSSRSSELSRTQIVPLCTLFNRSSSLLSTPSVWGSYLEALLSSRRP